MEEDIKSLRASAQVQYVGKFAEGKGGADPAAAANSPAATASAAVPATAPAASSGLSATDIGKGLGIK